MIGGSLRLGKILGIEIRIHYSWFLIFALVSYYIYSDFHDQQYDLSISLAMGLVASLALFVCIVAHELAHSIIAMRNGIPVRSITLFILGGVANITKEAERPKTEILMAIAGPLCSLVLGLVSLAAWFGTGGHAEGATSMFSWLAWLNLGLGVFNLLPGFPMDGGRVLRAILWQTIKDYRRATRIASVVGQVIGWIIAGAGVGIIIAYSAIGSGPFNIYDGIYFVLLGWFLSSIAASSYRQVAWREAMQGITATSAMVSDFIVIPPSISLKRLVEDYVWPKKQRSFVVATEGRLQGMVTIENIRKVPQSRWDVTTAGTAMTPADKVVSVAPEEEATNVAEKMETHRLDEIPVVRDGVVIGMVTRNNLIRLMQLRST